MLEDRITPASVIASSYFDSALYQFDASTGALERTLAAPSAGNGILSGPAGLTVGPDGNVYISSQFNNSILRYNFATDVLETFVSNSVLTGISSTFSPAGLAFGPDGDLYVAQNGGFFANAGSGAVVRFDVQSGVGGLTYANTSTVVASGLTQPKGLTFGVLPGDADSLYVSEGDIGFPNSGIGNVDKIASATTSPVKSTWLVGHDVGLVIPSGLAWGADGRLYVSDVGGAFGGYGKVMSFNAVGGDAVAVTPLGFTPPFTFAPGNLAYSFPAGVAFDGAGHLLTGNLGASQTANLLGSIGRYNLDGTYVGDLVTSGQFAALGTGLASGLAPSQLAVVTLDPTRSSVSLAGSPTVNANQSLSLTVTLTGHGPSTPTGTVTFTVDGGAPTTVSVSSLQASFTTGVLAAGPHTIVARYNGDANNAVEYRTASKAIASRITGATPFVGPTHGGDTVIISGSFAGLNPASASAVQFGGVNATSFVQLDGSSIAAVVPAGVNASVATIQVTTPYGDAVTFGNGATTGHAYVDMDFGDAPDTYGTTIAANGARHIATGVTLGTQRDADANGQPGAFATGDGADDDGVTFSSPLIIGSTGTALVTASAPGKLDAWLDFNGNGVFDAGEKIANSIDVSTTPTAVTFAVTGTGGATFARFRVSSAGGLSLTGQANDGEVEDYKVTLENVSVVSKVVNGDFAALSKVDVTGSTVTFTSNGDHGFAIGNVVEVRGYTDGNVGLNGSFEIASVTASTFTVNNTNGGLPSSLNLNGDGFAISKNTASGLLGVQRSIVASIAYTFNTPVTLASNAFGTLAARSTIKAGPATQASAAPNYTLTSLDGGLIWVVTWNGVTGHSIADGVYQITLDNTLVHTAGDHVPMSDVQSADVFYRIFGDISGFEASGLARVTTADSTPFGPAFLKSTGTVGYNAGFDFNGDGLITTTDSTPFGPRFLSVWNLGASGLSPTI